MKLAQKNTTVSRPRVTVSLPQDIYDYLIKRAETEIRPVSNLVEYLVVTTVKQQPDWEENKNEEQS